MKNQENKNTKIEDIPKDGMFNVPEGYFENFTGRVMQKVEALTPDTRPARTIPLKSRRVLLVAASIAGFIILSFAGYRALHIKHENNLLSQADTYEIVDYYASDFEENILIGNLPETKPASETESDAMISYLVDEGIDEITLLKAF